MSTATAQHTLAAAKKAVADLEEAVRSGDTTITVAQLSEAREAVSFAGLQLDAANRAVAAEQANNHAAQVAVLRERVDKFNASGHDPARKAYAKAVAALKELERLVESTLATIRDITNQAAELGVPPRLADPIGWGGHQFIDIAARDAVGAINRPHGLWSPERVNEYNKQMAELEEWQATRRAEFEKNNPRTPEVVVSEDDGTYTRRG